MAWNYTLDQAKKGKPMNWATLDLIWGLPNEWGTWLENSLLRKERNCPGRSSSKRKGPQAWRGGWQGENGGSLNGRAQGNGGQRFGRQVEREGRSDVGISLLRTTLLPIAHRVTVRYTISDSTVV